MARERRRSISDVTKYVGENQRFLTKGKPITNITSIDKKASRHFHSDFFIKVSNGKDHWSGSQKQAWHANGFAVRLQKKNWSK